MRLVITLLVVLTGCGKDDAKTTETPHRAPHPAPSTAVDAFVPAFDERAIEIATVTQDAAPPPERFAALMPFSAAEVKAFLADDPRFPPPDYVRDGLCRFATPAVLDAVDVVLTDPKAMKAWGDVVKSCEGPPLCVSAARVLNGPTRPVQALLRPVFDHECPPVKVTPEDQAQWDATSDKLRAAGMLGPEPVAIPMEPHSESQPFEDLPLEILEVAGRVDFIDTEGDGRSHAIPLRRIAYLVRPALDGVLFDEVRDGGELTLRAWFDGRRYMTPAHSKDGWFDLDAAVGLVNAILVDRDSPMRVLALGGDTGQLFDMAAGPRTALHAAVRAGLLQAYSGSE